MLGSLAALVRWVIVFIALTGAGAVSLQPRHPMAGDGNFDTWDDFRFLQWRPPTRVARAEVVPAEETQKEKYDIDGLKDFIYHTEEEARAILDGPEAEVDESGYICGVCCHELLPCSAPTMESCQGRVCEAYPVSETLQSCAPDAIESKSSSALEHVEEAEAQESSTKNDAKSIVEFPCKTKGNNHGHLFHLDCVRTWLESNGSCPVCRSCSKFARPKLTVQVPNDLNYREFPPPDSHHSAMWTLSVTVLLALVCLWPATQMHTFVLGGFLLALLNTVVTECIHFYHQNTNSWNDIHETTNDVYQTLGSAL